ncbi:MAG: hypothetical protein EAX91_15555 [Candidatus Lokiarchaeota archaeon]|nr:hypothetical protein [Candidatus Lokiarchaeota archaeon]
MIIKCPECGLEYSYGRNICHKCESNTILFGAIFEGPRQTYQWNCESYFNNEALSFKNIDSHKEFLRITSEEKDVKIEEILN